jgi:hypothetical protein
MAVPNLLAVVCGLQVSHPELVTLIFDIPVASAHYATGFSMRLNGVTLPVLSAALGTDTHQIVATLAGGPAYTATLDASYDATVGDWNNASSPVATFTRVPVVNGSVVGRPPTNYPLSSVITKRLVAVAGGFTGQVIADLNTVDANLCAEYAPQMVDFGGTFGVSMANPSGIMILQNLIALINGLSVSQTFTSTTPAFAAAAALDWEAQMAVKIGNALAALRTADASVSFGTDVIGQY